MAGELQGSDFSQFLDLLMLFAKEGSNGDLGVSVHGALACRHVIEEDNPPEQREFPLPSVKACQSQARLTKLNCLFGHNSKRMFLTFSDISERELKRILCMARAVLATFT